MLKSKLILISFLLITINSIAQKPIVLPYFDKDLGTWGYINTDFKIIQEPIFNSNIFLYKNVNIVNSKNLYGAINKRGEWLIKAEFSKLLRGSNSSFYVGEKIDSICFFDTHTGNHQLSIPNNSDYNLIKYYPLITIKKGDKTALFNLKTNKYYTENEYDNIINFNSFFKKHPLFKSKPRFNNRYEEQKFDYTAQQLYGSFLIIEKENLFGVINLKTGKIVIPCEYKSFNSPPNNSSGYFIEAESKKGTSIYYDNEFNKSTKIFDSPEIEEIELQDLVYDISPEYPGYFENSNNNKSKYFTRIESNSTGIIQEVETNGKKEIIVLKTIIIDSIWSIKKLNTDHPTDTYFKIQHTSNEYSIIDQNGKKIVEHCSEIQKYDSNIFFYKRNNLSGIINLAKSKDSGFKILSSEPTYHNNIRLITFINNKSCVDIKTGKIYHPNLEEDNLYEVK